MPIQPTDFMDTEQIVNDGLDGTPDPSGMTEDTTPDFQGNEDDDELFSDGSDATQQPDQTEATTPAVSYEDPREFLAAQREALGEENYRRMMDRYAQLERDAAVYNTLMKDPAAQAAYQAHMRGQVQAAPGVAQGPQVEDTDFSPIDEALDKWLEGDKSVPVSQVLKSTINQMVTKQLTPILQNLGREVREFVAPSLSKTEEMEDKTIYQTFVQSNPGFTKNPELRELTATFYNQTIAKNPQAGKQACLDHAYKNACRILKIQATPGQPGVTPNAAPNAIADKRKMMARAALGGTGNRISIAPEPKRRMTMQEAAALAEEQVAGMR